MATISNLKARNDLKILNAQLAKEEAEEAEKRGLAEIVERGTKHLQETLSRILLDQVTDVPSVSYFRNQNNHMQALLTIPLENVYVSLASITMKHGEYGFENWLCVSTCAVLHDDDDYSTFDINRDFDPNNRFEFLSAYQTQSARYERGTVYGMKQQRMLMAREIKTAPAQFALKTESDRHPILCIGVTVTTDTVTFDLMQMGIVKPVTVSSDAIIVICHA